MEPETRQLSADELSTVLARFGTREPRTKLGAGPIREFTAFGPTAAVRYVAPRRDVTPLPRLSRYAEVDAGFARRKRRARWPRHRALLVVAFVALGLLLGGALAYAVEAARVPPALPVVPPTVSAPAAIERDEPPPREAHVMGGSIEARRRAVDLLLAGRTRAALEQYQALLDDGPLGLVDAPTIAHVVRLLTQELRDCEQEASTPCGL